MPEIAQDEVYKDGVLQSRAPRTAPDIEIRARDAEQRLRAGRTQLRTIRTQAKAAADSGAALTLVQLTNQFRQLAQAVAIEAQTLMDIELMLAWHQDDGQD